MEVTSEVEKGQRQGVRSEDGVILEPFEKLEPSNSFSNVPDLLAGIT